MKRYIFSFFLAILFALIQPQTVLATVLSAPQGGTGLGVYIRGDQIVATSTNQFVRVPIGTEGQLWSIVNGLPAWATTSTLGVGNVIGPALSTDSSVALFDGITGKLLKSPMNVKVTSGTLSLASTTISNGIRQRFVTDDAFGDYVITQASFTNPYSSRNNQSLRIGYNKRSAGGQENVADQHQLGIDFESFYTQTPGQNVWELHVPSYVDASGTEWRPLSFQGELLSSTNNPGNIAAAFTVDNLNLIARTSTGFTGFSIANGASSANLSFLGGSHEILALGANTAGVTRAIMGVGGYNTSRGSFIDTYSDGTIIFTGDEGLEFSRFNSTGSLLINTTTDRGKLTSSGNSYFLGNHSQQGNMTVTGTLNIASSTLTSGIRQKFLTDDSFGDYTITQGSFDNIGTTTKNQSLRIGFNKAVGGAPLTAGRAAMGLDFESFFLQSPNDPVMEFHIPSIVDTDGFEKRPLSLQYHLVSGTSTAAGQAFWGFNAQQISLGNTTGSPYGTLAPTQWTFASTSFRVNQNNINILSQGTVDGLSTVELLRVDGENNVRLSPSGASVYIPGNAKGTLNIAATSTFALVNIGAGPSASSSGIGFQGDTNIYRSQANVLATDDFFLINQPTTADGLIITASSGSSGGYKLTGGSGEIIEIGCRNSSCSRALIGVGGIDQSLGANFDMFNTGLIVVNSDNAVETMRFTAAGELLINTTTNRAKLTVDGTGYFSGNVNVSGTLSTSGLNVTNLRATNVTSTNVQVDESILVGNTVAGKYINFYNGGYGITAASGLELKSADYIRFMKSATQQAVIDNNGNFGLGILAFDASAKLQFNTSTLPAGGILFGSDTSLYRFAANTLRTDSATIFGGHSEWTGASPTTTSCGTLPSIVGTDNVFRVTAGIGIFTTCSVTFATPWVNAPVCSANNETAAGVALQVQPTTSTLTITSASALTSVSIGVLCNGYR